MSTIPEQVLELAIEPYFNSILEFHRDHIDGDVRSPHDAALDSLDDALADIDEELRQAEHVVATDVYAAYGWLLGSANALDRSMRWLVTECLAEHERRRHQCKIGDRCPRCDNHTRGKIDRLGAGAFSCSCCAHLWRVKHDGSVWHVPHAGEDAKQD